MNFLHLNKNSFRMIVVKFKDHCRHLSAFCEVGSDASIQSLGQCPTFVSSRKMHLGGYLIPRERLKPR